MTEILENGLYVGSSYSQYYTLQLPNTGNVFLTVAGDNGASAIYDENLNFVADITGAPILLPAGSYIINTNYSSPNLAALNVYVPQLSVTGDLIQLESGSYHASSWSNFYSLDISSAKNIAFGVYGDSGHAVIYDKNLNYVAEITSATMYLDAGSYIVAAGYSSPTNGELSVLILNAFTGNELSNKLTGDSSANVLYGLGGNDSLTGNAGNDSLIGGDGADTAIYSEKTGIVSVTLNGANVVNVTVAGVVEDKISYIENLQGGTGNDVFVGDSLANALFGNGGSDRLSGMAGNDSLNGGVGVDTMIGGDGSDTYYVDNIGDVVMEINATASTGGTDVVNSYLATYTLGANVENGRIVTTVVANITGNTLANTLYAGSGVNIIDGSSGTDTVSFQYATTTGSIGVTLSLAVVDGAGYSIASGISGPDKVIRIENITGTNYADKLTGDSGNNVLNGLSGNDNMAGGLGNDTYVINALSDVVTELSGQGTDRIQSTITYSLADTDGTGSNGGNVEDIQLTGTGNINGTGNALNNVLFSNAGNNILDGVTGVDTASYQYAAAGVTVTLATNAQQNTVNAGLDTLKNIDNLTGSNYADSLTGNTVANTITGLGGKDTMKGNGGADTFKFNAVTDSAIGTTRDVILDFGADDFINLATIDANTALAGDQAFSAIKTGTFSATTSFTSADVGKLFFDTTSKILYGNTDTDAAAEFSIQLTLTGITTVTTADFVL